VTINVDYDHFMLHCIRCGSPNIMPHYLTNEEVKALIDEQNPILHVFERSTEVCKCAECGLTFYYHVCAEEVNEEIDKRKVIGLWRNPRAKGSRSRDTGGGPRAGKPGRG